LTEPVKVETTPAQSEGKLSQWRESIVKRILEEMPARPSEQQRADCLQEIANALGKLQGWERCYPKALHTVVEKGDYRLVCDLGRPHGNGPALVQALNDGRLVSGGGDGTLRIWSERAPGGWEGETLAGHTGEINALHALPDGRLVSTEATRMLVWSKGDTGTWRFTEVAKSDRHKFDGILRVLPDGTIVSGSFGGTLALFTDLPGKGWRKDDVYVGDRRITVVEPLVDGRLLVLTEYESATILVRGPSGGWYREYSTPLENLPYGHHTPMCAQVLPTNEIVLGDATGMIHVWQLTDSGELRPNDQSSFPISGLNPVQCLHWLPNARLLTGGNNCRLEKVDPAIGCLMRLDHDGTVRCVQALTDGRIISSDQSGRIYVWDGTPIEELAQRTRDAGSRPQPPNDADGFVAWATRAIRSLLGIETQDGEFTEEPSVRKGS